MSFQSEDSIVSSPDSLLCLHSRCGRLQRRYPSLAGFRFRYYLYSSVFTLHISGFSRRGIFSRHSDSEQNQRKRRKNCSCGNLIQCGSLHALASAQRADRESKRTRTVSQSAFSFHRLLSWHCMQSVVHFLSVALGANYHSLAHGTDLGHLSWRQKSCSGMTVSH